MTMTKFLAPAGGALLLFAASCASTGTTAGASRPATSQHTAYLTPAEEMEAKARAYLASIDHPAATRASFERVSIQRAEIGAYGLPGTLAHETAIKGVSDRHAADGKIANLTTGGGEAGPVLIAGTANGGWVEEEEAFRHTLSGMTCPKTALLLAVSTAANAIDVYSVPLVGIELFAEDGSDTACQYVSDGYLTFTVFASRWPNISLDEHYEAALRDITEVWPVEAEAPVFGSGDSDEEADEESAESDEGPAPGSSIEGETRRAGFMIANTGDNPPLKTILLLNKTGDWHVKGRLTFATSGQPLDFAELLTETFSETAYEDRLDEVDQFINSGALMQVKF